MSKNVILNFNGEDIKIFEVNDKGTKEGVFFNSLFPIKPDKTKNLEFEKNIKNLFTAIIFHYVSNGKGKDILKIDNSNIILYFNNGGKIIIGNQSKEIKLDLKKWKDLETAILQYIAGIIIKNNEFLPIFFTIMYNVYYKNNKYNTLEKFVSTKKTVDVLNNIYEKLYIKK